MRTHHAATAALLATALALTACGSRGDDWTGSLRVDGPYEAAGRLVWFSRHTSLVTVLDPKGETDPAHVGVVDRPRAFGVTPTSVLVVGGRGDAPALDIVALESLDTRRVELAGAYDRVAVSPDGAHAVLFYDPAVPPAPGGPAARNNNEISVVSVSQASAKAVALRTESIAPQQVVFSRDGKLAAVVLDGAVAVVELARPEVHVHVPLKMPGGAALTPKEALFSPDGAFVYVRAAGTDDVLALELTHSPGELGATINFLFFPGARGLLDILVPDAPGFERYVAALYASGTALQVALLDATGDASRALSTPLTALVTAMEDLGGGRILMWSPASQAIAAWAPFDERLDEDRLSGTIQGTPRFGDGVAYFPHASVQSASGTSSAMTAVALEDDGARLRLRLNPLVLGGKTTATAIDPESGTFVAAVQVPRKDSGASPELGQKKPGYTTTGALVTVDPGTLRLGGVALDEGVASLGIVDGAVYALHASTLGDVTFLPLASPERDKARRVAGFLAGGLLDLGEEIQ